MFHQTPVSTVSVSVCLSISSSCSFLLLFQFHLPAQGPFLLLDFLPPCHSEFSLLKPPSHSSPLHPNIPCIRLRNSLTILLQLALWWPLTLSPASEHAASSPGASCCDCDSSRGLGAVSCQGESPFASCELPSPRPISSQTPACPSACPAAVRGSGRHCAEGRKCTPRLPTWPRLGLRPGAGCVGWLALEDRSQWGRDLSQSPKQSRQQVVLLDLKGMFLLEGWALLIWHTLEEGIRKAIWNLCYQSSPSRAGRDWGSV